MGKCRRKARRNGVVFEAGDGLGLMTSRADRASERPLHKTLEVRCEDVQRLWIQAATRSILARRSHILSPLIARRKHVSTGLI